MPMLVFVQTRSAKLTVYIDDMYPNGFSSENTLT
jgi:hypothetical protein